MRGDAGEAGGHARYDERSDVGSNAGEGHGKMRYVIRHEPRRRGGQDHVRGDEHDRGELGMRRRGRRERECDVDVEPCGGEPARDGVETRLRHGVCRADRHQARVAGLRSECRSDRAEESRRLDIGRRTQRLGERPEGAVGDAALQFAHDPELPRRRVGDARDGFRSELQDGRGAPHRGMGGVDAQHGSILPASAPLDPLSTGPARPRPA
jgi:hypothetical protein